MARGDRSRQGGERTAEERERAREERERRRSGRSPAAEAADAQDPPAGSDAPAAGETPAPEVGARSEPVSAAEPQPVLEDPAPGPAAAEPEPDPLAARDPAPATAAASSAAVPVTAGDDLGAVEPAPSFEDPVPPPAPVGPLAPGPEPFASQEPPGHDDSESSPAPEREPPAAEPGLEPPIAEANPLALPLDILSERPRASAVATGGGRLPPPPPLPGGRAPRTHRPRPGRQRAGALVALAAVLVAVAGLLYALLHKSSHPKAAAGPKIVKVLIPEGKTRAQIAEIAARAGLKGDYRVASRHSELLNPAQYGAPSSTHSLEGFLFPATYDEYQGAPASRLVAEQLEAFKQNFGSELASRAHALKETPYQLLTVASMIEREAQIPGDRAKIAAVIYNRLRLGMPLGIDATIYYAIEEKTGIATYTHELTESQLQINSAYNTRTHVGLPPTPISNPGLASIEAAAKPAHVSYLYYVAGADGCGEQVFANTSAEFEADDAAYKEAVSKNGGHPPACKK